MRLRLVSAMLACIALIPAGLAAQAPTPTRVKYQVSCPRCAIEITKVATFGNPNDPVPLERGGGRMTVLSPKLQYVRSIPLPAGSIAQAYSVASGQFLISARLTGLGQAGFLYHVLDRNGAVVRSFGSGDANGRGPASRGLASRTWRQATERRPGANWATTISSVGLPTERTRKSRSSTCRGS